MLSFLRFSALVLISSTIMAAGLPGPGSLPATNVAVSSDWGWDTPSLPLEGTRDDSFWAFEREHPEGKDRRRMHFGPDSPFDKIGRLDIQLPDNRWSWCTASLVAPHLILTARHCVRYGWSATYSFKPAAQVDDDERFPNVKQRVYPWRQGADGESGSDEEWALLMLPFTAYPHVDYFNLTDPLDYYDQGPRLDHHEGGLELYGYPADGSRDGSLFFGMRGVGLTSNLSWGHRRPDERPLRHNGTATWGQAGAPILQARGPWNDTTYEIVGVHVGADNASNVATCSKTLDEVLYRARMLPARAQVETFPCTKCAMQADKFGSPPQTVDDQGSLFTCECNYIGGDPPTLTSSLDLDEDYLGVRNGSFVWFSNGYQSKCRNFNLDKWRYSAECQTDVGTWVNTTIDLSYYILVDHTGVLKPYLERNFISPYGGD